MKSKVCNICKIEKVEEEFSKFLAKSGNVLLKYCCKDCDNKTEKVNNKASRLYTSYRLFDAKKNLEFSMTKEFIEKGLNSSCSYCGYPSTGFDRLFNNIGHTDTNCISCCWECNTARMNNFNYQEMIEEIGPAIKRIKDKRNNIN